MHQPIPGDPKDPNSSQTPLHRVAVSSNVNLGDLWMSQRPDEHQHQSVSATYAYTRGYRPAVYALKLPGCFLN
jgi:hypothetical protein